MWIRVTTAPPFPGIGGGYWLPVYSLLATCGPAVGVDMVNVVAG